MREVRRDFGTEYAFLEKRQEPEAVLELLTEGSVQEFPSTQWDYVLRVYTGGKYAKVVYQRRRIPTFDSSDRMYDSWHDLYLIRETDGRVWAVYATGGYQISSVESWQQVLSCPKDIQELLEK